MSPREPQIASRGTSHHVEANGLRHHVLSYGHGEDVLVLPGITSPAITWEFVAEELSSRGWRVWLVDIRGRGLSDKPDSGYTLLDYAEDAAGIIRMLALRRPAIVGHSMGARIAAALGSRHREACGALVIVDPPLSGPGRDPYPTSLDGFLSQLREAQRGTTPDEVRRYYPSWTLRELEIRADWLATCSESAVTESHRGFESEDFFEHWRRLTPPVLFVYGGESPMVTPAGARDVLEANQQAAGALIEAAGHMIPWDNLDGFISVVTTFLADPGADRGTR